MTAQRPAAEICCRSSALALRAAGEVDGSRYAAAALRMPIGGSFCRRQVIVGILDANSSPAGRSGSSDSIHRKCLRSCAPPCFSETSAWRAGQNSCSLVATRPAPTSSMNAVATRSHVAGIRCCSRTTMPSTSCCQWRSSSAGSSARWSATSAVHGRRPRFGFALRLSTARRSIARRML